MTITTLSSQAFQQDVRGARRAADHGPVIITERGRPSHVLLSIEAYRNLTRTNAGIADLLGMPGAADFDFEAPRAGHLMRPWAEP